MSANLYIGLVHYPIINKHGEVITTAVTNYDVHDIARASRTYDISAYFIIHNVEAQRQLVERIMGHWQEGYGSQYNPDRKDAFSEIILQSSTEDVMDYIKKEEGQAPLVITTDARVYPNSITYGALRRHLEEESQPVLLLFGTGYGMTQEMMNQFDYILEPIYGYSTYNHLSVRSAVSIILDRLRGDQWWTR